MLLPGATAVIKEHEAATASKGRWVPEAMAEATEKKRDWVSRRTFGRHVEDDGDVSADTEGADDADD